MVRVFCTVSRSLLLSLLLHCLVANADGGIPRVITNCITDKNWQAVKCEVASYDALVAVSAQYSEVALGSAIFSTFSTLMNTRQGALCYVDRKFGLECSAAEGTEKLLYLAELVKATKAKQQLSECQSACLAKCASANFLEYPKDWSDSKLSLYNLASTAEAAKVERGQCMKISETAAQFLDAVGIKSKLVYGPEHMFIKFKADGVWYYAEPQNARCKLYKK